MGGIRAWLAAAVACCLLVPAAASAAAPGDRVTYEIPDSARGDTYTVSVDDHKVADGVDDTDEEGVSGEFTMPDLGSEPREVTVLIQLVAAADGSTRSYENSVEYHPAETSGAKPTSTPPPPRPATPPPAPPPSTPASKPNPLPLQTTPAAPPAAPRKLSDSGGKILRAPERVLHGLTQAAPLRHRGSPAERRRARRHARRARHKANHFRAGPESVPPKVRSLSPPRDTRANLSDSHVTGLGYSVAWKLLAAVAAAGLLLPFLVAARTHMRRRREAEMEAELQEMLAEARADSELLR